MNNDAAQGRKLAEYLHLQRELLDKLAAITQEMDDLLAGKAGIGQKLKACYAAYDAAWGHRYANGSGGHYQFNFREDAPHLRRFLRTMSVDELSRRFVAYISDAEPFLVTRRHPFSLFVRNINQYALAGKDVELVVGEEFFTCDHAPKCRSAAVHATKVRVEAARG